MRGFPSPQVYTSIAKHPFSGQVWHETWLSESAITTVHPWGMKQWEKTFKIVILARSMPLIMTFWRDSMLLIRSYSTSYTSRRRCLPIERFSNSVFIQKTIYFWFLAPYYSRFRELFQDTRLPKGHNSQFLLTDPSSYSKMPNFDTRQGCTSHCLSECRW